jgi:adenosylhomocysteine nucleosidase
MREPGTVAASTAFADIIREASPQLVCVCGIAGAIIPSLSLGDVVVANKIIYYDRRKITDEGVSREACIYKISAQVVDIVNAYSRENRKGNERRTVDKKPHDFKAIVAPLGCGEAILAKRNSNVKEWLLATDRKTAAVEMESAGVTHALWETTQSHIQRLLGILVVRGISDGADEKKRDEYQYDAAANAAFVLKKLLRYYRSHFGIEVSE